MVMISQTDGDHVTADRLLHIRCLDVYPALQACSGYSRARDAHSDCSSRSLGTLPLPLSPS